MVNANFYIDGTLVNPPKNWPDMLLELNYNNDRFPNVNQVSITDWEWVRENARDMLDYINNGKIYEGRGLKVELERAGIIEKVFDGYLDLADGGAKFSKISCTIKAKSHLTIDWLSDQADGFTFEYLYRETSELTDADNIYMPYVLNSVPDYLQSAVATLSVFVLVKEIKEAIKELAFLASEAGGYFTTIPAIIKGILYIAYLIILIASLITLIQQVIKFIIQPVKYHAGMYAKRQLEVGAAHLGLTFKSDIFDVGSAFEKMLIIPRKLYNPPTKFNESILGFITPNPNEMEGFYKGSFGDLLRAMKIMFKAKLIITTNSELFLVREDQSVTSPQYTIPDIQNFEFTTNADELISNYLLTFQTDVQDKNTIQQYIGTSYQVITEPTSFVNRAFVLTKGFEEAPIPFALTKRKTDLTVPEQIVKVVLDIFDALVNGLISGINLLISGVNAIISMLNKIIKALKVIGIKLNWQIKSIPSLPPINLASVIDNRIGMMMIEYDNFQVDKVVIITPGSSSKLNKVSTTNSTVLSARYLWDNFHFIISFLSSFTFPNGNQYVIKEYTNVPFSYSDYLKVKLNNKIYNAQGGTGIIETVRWNAYQQHADIRVRFSRLYAPNLKESYLEPDGR